MEPIIQEYSSQSEGVSAPNETDSGFHIKETWKLENWSNVENEFNLICQHGDYTFSFTLTRCESDFVKITVEMPEAKEEKEFSFQFSVINEIPKETTTNPNPIKCSFSEGQTKHTIRIPVFQSAVSNIQKGYIHDDVVIIEIEITYTPTVKVIPVQTPIYHVSEPEVIPYVGLRNQGATCYMNSMLQSLFHIPAFRLLIYTMDSTMQNKSDDQNICLNLQRLFGLMQLSDSPVSTKSLTRSFGWSDSDSFIQHDIQEFCRVLLDNLEEKMKKTNLEGRIPDLFRGESRSFIRCRNVDYESSRSEYFYDLQLDVVNCNSLEESFVKYVEHEELDGDNKYDTEEYGKQEADMGVEFIEFPKVLHLHLRRFQYDFNYNRMTKINSYFSFPKTIDLKPYLIQTEENQDEDWEYELFGILVHSGYAYGGHYFAYLRTTPEEKWYKFNDSSVSIATEAEAIDNNFGGVDKYSTSNYERTYSAYMLIYIKQSEIQNIYHPISNDDIPKSIIDYYHDFLTKKKEKEEKRYQIQNTLHIGLVDDTILEYNAQNNNFSFKTKKFLCEKFDVKRYDKCEYLYAQVEQQIKKSEFALNRALAQIRRVAGVQNVNTNGKTFTPSNNISPGSVAPIVTAEEISLLLWGTQVLTNTVINARVETVMKKFQNDITQRRCVVPADGYFEWNKEKQPYFFHKQNDEIMFLAAFYNQRGEFVILTREATKQVNSIHHRMPIIFGIDQLALWSSPKWEILIKENEPIVSFYPVSRLSLRPGYTGAECIAPIKVETKVQKSLLDMLKTKETKPKIEEISRSTTDKERSTTEI
ncbi:Clan CA, family C19, ubiquitin hydrolase-like cysteine peptidase [Histomonas meleagridis]|uniref:Clan CA, family C19, ubiquitin hydrolase-like cysteine peptidase n=1 Tax=Histomonas meleagridis TaxID=135588 RepID=UPI003559D0D2|nr:Clan CA, family C19, ubiquitin hydrolase-like cysteine peptidase [Histomonas meleagridis]KAH0799927.1 Clan CA, family C19, ubiquitin hydrolase-like cysteine peptidase [Histomonas meleagridis]